MSPHFEHVGDLIAALRLFACSHAWGRGFLALPDQFEQAASDGSIMKRMLSY
jgi:hypothetical protein